MSSFCAFVPFVAPIFTIARLEIARSFSLFSFFFPVVDVNLIDNLVSKGQTDPLLPNYRELL